MDAIFQSLLLHQSSPTPRTNLSVRTNNVSGGDGGGGSVAQSNENKRGRSIMPMPPRPSRFAQLLPREALRLPPTPSNAITTAAAAAPTSMKHHRHHRKHNHKNSNNRRSNQSSNVDGGDEIIIAENEALTAKAPKEKNGVSKSMDADVYDDDDDDDKSKGGMIHVYRRNDSTGHLEELLPEQDYELFYLNGHDNDETMGEQLTNRGGDDLHIPSDNIKMDGVPIDENNGEEDVIMNTEEHDDNNNAETSLPINDADIELNQQEDTIYIIKTPSSRNVISKNSYQPQESDTASVSTSSSNSSTYSGSKDISIHQKQQFAYIPKPEIKEATSMASSIARALVSRTEGFEKLRPSYEMIMENEEREQKLLMKKKKEKEIANNKKKLLAAATASSLSSTTTSLAVSNKEGRDKKSGGGGSGSSSSTPKKKNDVQTHQDGEGDDTLGTKSLEGKGRSLLFQSTTIPHANKVLDGDSLETLHRLTKLRVWQESQIEPCMQGVELENWEDGIDWEGADSNDDDLDDDSDYRQGNNNKEAMANNCKDTASSEVDQDNGINNVGTTTRIMNVPNEDCTEDFIPPVPMGGYAKRPKRMLLRLPHYDDPMQLLYEPRNPRLEALDLSAIDWQGAYSDSDQDADDENESVHVPLILHSSIAGQSVATLLAPNPMSRPQPFDSHPNYLQRYEREMASEITSTADLAKPGSFGENEALEKYKEARQRKREQMAKDKQNRVTEVMSALSLTGTGRRITSSLMGPGGAERTGRPNRHSIGSSLHDSEYVEQLELVHNHSLVKPALTKSEYRQFHRPRLPELVVNPSRPWQFQARLVIENKRGGKRGGNANAATTDVDGSTIVGSYHAMISAGAKGQSKIRNENDLSPSIGDLVVLEYSEERPPLFMSKGMTCRIVNYYRGDRSRCPVSAGGGDRPLRKRHGDKAASTTGSAASGPSDRAERPPRLVGPNQYTIKNVSDLIGIARSEEKKSKEAAALEIAKKAKENAIDMLPEGVTEVIHHKIHGPFLGEVEEGTTQSGLICNLFAAPIFRHESKLNDFLMILGQLQDGVKSGVAPSSERDSATGALGVMLRPFPPNIYCVGQTEPRVKVFAPNSNDERKFVNAFVPYQVAKHIQRAEEMNDGCGLTFDFIKDNLFGNSLIPRGQLRQRVKQVANFERGNSGIWSLKALNEDNFPGVEALGRKVSPEGVASYESQCAALRRLQDLGVKELCSGANTVANVAAAMIYLNGAAQAALERRLKMKKVLEIKSRQKSPQLDYFEKALEKLDAEYKEVKKRQEIAKFIYEELQLSPWNLSGDFIEVHKKAVGGAVMKLTGIGDPSGVGEAYNFLREADTRASKSTSATDGALSAQIKKITGTENDLRKLTMKQMASLLRSYGMKDKQIDVLKRWDRVHVIRDLSTKAASDGLGDDMERFARGEKLRISDQRQNYKQRIQEICRRQVAALSADAGNEVLTRSDMTIDSANNTDETDRGSNVAEEKEDSHISDSSDDDDFLTEIEMEMTNTGEANRLVNDLRGKGSGTFDELNKDARDFAALQRQREEERSMQAGLVQKSASIIGKDKQKKKCKVIRRKITKTSPDGTQTVTFEFIVDRDKVEDIIARLKQKESGEKKKKKLSNESSGDLGDTTCVGHATFEDEDNAKSKRSLKIKVKKETHVIRKKGPGPMKASALKFSNSIKHARAQAKENRKKKLRKQEEESEVYKKNVRGKGTSNRKERGSARDRMPHVMLADRLESIRSAVEARPNAGAFLKPVPREIFPKYYEVIHEPIDLSTIREKNRKYGYNSADDFVLDFQLMKNNAIKFNQKGSPLANEAEEMWMFVKNAIAQNRKEFNEMEEAVQDQKNGKKKKKSNSRSVSESSNQDVPMNTANVVVDGVKTWVNLGSITSCGIGGDSDSDNS